MSENHQIVTLVNPTSEHHAKFIVANAPRCERVSKMNDSEGQHIVVCGAGPTLAEHIADYTDADQLWGCNSAVMWLHSEGYKPTHGFSIDQTAHMCAEWYDAPHGLTYLVASSVHPHLTEYLLAEHHRLEFFHNYVGLPGPPVKYGVCKTCGAWADSDAPACEMCGAPELDPRVMSWETWLYVTHYDGTVRVGGGLNSVSRAVELALFKGAAKISVLGADCALRANSPAPGPVGTREHSEWIKGVQMHVDGSNALRSGATQQTMEAVIDGRLWVTKPDMAMTAVFLNEMRDYYDGRVELVGDTLPNAIRGKPQDWLDRLPSMNMPNGERVRYEPSTYVLTG